MKISTVSSRFTLTILSLLVVCISMSYSQQVPFNNFFSDKTMRMDYFHTGMKGQETISLDAVYMEGAWPGSKVNLVDTLNMGEYLMRVYDVATNSLIYSRGYSTIYGEWMTTDESNTTVRTFHESVRFPYPQRKAQVTISRRDKYMAFHEIFSTVIDPANNSEVTKKHPMPTMAIGVPVRLVTMSSK